MYLSKLIWNFCNPLATLRRGQLYAQLLKPPPPPKWLSRSSARPHIWWNSFWYFVVFFRLLCGATRGRQMFTTLTSSSSGWRMATNVHIWLWIQEEGTCCTFLVAMVKGRVTVVWLHRGQRSQAVCGVISWYEGSPGTWCSCSGCGSPSYW